MSKSNNGTIIPNLIEENKLFNNAIPQCKVKKPIEITALFFKFYQNYK